MSRESAANQERLDRVLAEYLEEADGLGPDSAAYRSLRERYLADHPELASELESHFEAEDAIGRGGIGSVTIPDFDRYSDVAHIGQGAMGIVYKAFDRELERWVALKMSLSLELVSQNEARRFKMEAQSMARLKHPNIVRVFDVNDYEGRPFLSMELVSGGTLDGHLDRFRDDPPEAARLMVEIARGVHHAHQRGILHRDLKPSNILLDTDEHGPDRPHVSDFGLAKPIDSTESRAERRIRLGPGTTEYGKIVGTASFMSPEQASGKDATSLSDVYGLGGILYALLTGRAPFRGESVQDTLEQVKAPSRRPPPPRELNPRVDPTLEAICMKCLEKEPERRYQSAEGLAKELERWLGHHPTEARPLSTLGRLKLWGRRRPLGLAFVGAMLLLAGLTGWSVYDQLQAGWVRQGEVARFEAATIQEHLIDPLREVVAELARDPNLGRRLSDADRTGLQSYLLAEAGRIDGFAGVSPFESCYVMQDGYIQARWPEMAEEETDFSNRGYYTEAAAMTDAGAIVSEVFFSVSDHFYKFAIAAPILDGTRTVGMLACSVATTARIGTTPMDGEGYSIAVLAPRDPSRVTGEEAAEAPGPPDASRLLVFSHPFYAQGERPAWVRQSFFDAHRQVFAEGTDGCVDDYVDPVALDVPGAEAYSGVWSACFGHVEASPFIVVVQRRSQSLMNLTWWSIPGILLALLVAGACMQYLRPRLGRAAPAHHG